MIKQHIDRIYTAHPENQVYPYLLKNLVIAHPDHVWITEGVPTTTSLLSGCGEL